METEVKPLSPEAVRSRVKNSVPDIAVKVLNQILEEEFASSMDDYVDVCPVELRSRLILNGAGSSNLMTLAQSLFDHFRSHGWSIEQHGPNLRFSTVNEEIEG